MQNVLSYLTEVYQVIGKSLPFAEVKTALKKNSKNETNAYALPDNDPIKAKIKEICSEALLDQRLGIISIRKTSAGKWERTNSTSDRRGGYICKFVGVAELNYETIKIKDLKPLLSATLRETNSDPFFSNASL